VILGFSLSLITTGETRAKSFVIESFAILFVWTLQASHTLNLLFFFLPNLKRPTKIVLFKEKLDVVQLSSHCVF